MKTPFISSATVILFSGNTPEDCFAPLPRSGKGHGFTSMSIKPLESSLYVLETFSFN